jgi:hypothetical protein
LAGLRELARRAATLSPICSGDHDAKCPSPSFLRNDKVRLMFVLVVIRNEREMLIHKPYFFAPPDGRAPVPAAHISADLAADSRAAVCRAEQERFLPWNLVLRSSGIPMEDPSRCGAVTGLTRAWCCSRGDRQPDRRGARAGRSRSCQREPEVPAGRFRADVRIRILDPRSYRARPQIRAPILLRGSRRDRLQRVRRPRLWRLRLPVLHDWHDFPGLRHQHRVQADPADSIAPRLAIVSPGYRDIATSINLVAGLAR